MSRTNPYKRKKRQAKKTLLIFGEGMNEEMFLKYLRTLYSHNTDVAITVKKGKGGDQNSIVMDASRVPGGFHRRVVVLDNDKSEDEIKKARITAKNNRIELIENTPCLEYLLLSTLDSNKIGRDSAECKKIFEKKYLNKKQRKEACKYSSIFSKELLNKKRKTIEILDKILQIMEGS